MDLTEFTNTYNAEVEELYKTKLFQGLGGKRESLFIFIPGLNLKPNALDEIIHWHQQRGLDCLRLALMCTFEDEYRIDSWQDQVLDIIDLSRKSYKHIYLFGYSVGGALSVWAANERKDIKGLTLLAPALKLNWFSHIAEQLPQSNSLYLPSFAKEEYKMNKGVSFTGYKALKKVRTEALEVISTLKHLPIFASICEDDELVSYNGVKDIFEGRTNWSFHPIPPVAQRNISANNHLIVDRKALGEENWPILLKELERFYQNHL